MNRNVRRAIVFALFLIFSVAAPLVLTWTAGYRYNWKKGRPEMTGIIKVDSRPSGADVWLNGQLQPQRSPTSIFRLLPGSYEIKLSKVGYHDWNKTLVVADGETTFTDSVVLLRQDKPQQLEQDIADWFQPTFSPDGTMVAGLRPHGVKTRLSVAGTAGGPTTDLDVLTVTTKTTDKWRLNWSPSGDWLILDDGGAVRQLRLYGLYGARLDRPRLISAAVPTGATITSFHWTSGDRLTLVTDFAAYEYDPSLGQARRLTRAPMDALLWSDQLLELTAPDSSGDVTLSIRQPATEPPTELLRLPPGRYRFADYGDSYLLLSDVAADRSWLYDRHGERLFGPLPATRISWQKSGQRGKPLLWDDFEIYSLNMTDGQPELLTRIDRPIIGCDWHVSGRVAFYATAADLNAIELDGRDRRNEYRLADGLKLQSLNIAGDRKVLRFVNDTEGKYGLFGLEY